MRFYFYFFILGALFLAACSKKLDIDSPDFDVTTDSLSYAAGQPVNFKFTGDAHVISFYSGEPLKDYAFKDGRTFDVTSGGATFQFSSSLQLGTQTNQLTILASSNFNGDYSSVTSLKAATWTDITNRFTIGTTATFVPSGTAPTDISDLFVAGKPLYIAFRYITRPQATNGLARAYYFQSMFLKSKTDSFNNNPLTIYDQNSLGFRIVDENKENAPARSLVSPTRLTLYGNEYLYAGLPRYDPSNPLLDPNNPIFDPQSPSYDPMAVLQKPFDPNSPYNDPLSENWAVSRPITLGKVNLGPDVPVAIKAGIAAAPLTLYTYTYKFPGTYNAVFVGSNSSIDESKTYFKTITLTIR